MKAALFLLIDRIQVQLYLGSVKLHNMILNVWNSASVSEEVKVFVQAGCAKSEKV